MAQAASQHQGISQDSRQVAMGLHFKNLRADMGMQTLNPGPTATSQMGQHLLQLIGIKAELAVEMPGADVFVRVALNARGEAQHQRHRFVAALGQLLQQGDVVPVIDHHRHTVLHSQGQFLAGFVVAMQHDSLRRHAALECRQQLTG